MSNKKAATISWTFSETAGVADLTFSSCLTSFHFWSSYTFDRVLRKCFEQGRCFFHYQPPVSSQCLLACRLLSTGYVILLEYTHTHNRFTALLESVRDYPGEQVPER